MRDFEPLEFVARAAGSGDDRPFPETLDLRTFMRRLSEAVGTSPDVNAQTTDLASAIALRVPVNVTARRPARSLAPPSSVPDLVAVSCRLVNVDHRNRLRLRSVLRGVDLPRRLDVLELGGGFAVLGVVDDAAAMSGGIELRLDEQQRLLLTPGVAHRLGLRRDSRQLLVAGDAESQQVALVHLGALLAKAREVRTAETSAP